MKAKLPVMFASLHPLFGTSLLQELLLFSLTVLRICIRKMLLLNMEMEGNPVQVTQENFQHEKPMIPACNLGQISKVQIQMQISHLASCRVGSCKAPSVVFTAWTTCHTWHGRIAVQN